MYISVHPPSPYLVRHGQQLLPHWDDPVLSVLVVLQPCGCELLAGSAIAEVQKHQLRQNFLQMGRQLVAQLEALGYAAALFDPRTGLPVGTTTQPVAGLARSPTLDDVAVVRSCLGYEIVASHGCSLILHPHWGSAVYPSTLLSSAPPAAVTAVVTAVCHHATTLAPLAVGALDTT